MLNEAYTRVEYRLEREGFDSVPALVRYYVGNRKPVSQVGLVDLFLWKLSSKVRCLLCEYCTYWPGHVTKTLRKCHWSWFCVYLCLKMVGAIIFQPVNRGLPLRCLEEKYGLSSSHRETLMAQERRSQKRLSLNITNGHTHENTTGGHSSAHGQDNSLGRGCQLRLVQKLTRTCWRTSTCCAWQL